MKGKRDLPARRFPAQDRHGMMLTMAFDSIIGAATLFAAAVAGWMSARPQRAASRLYVRFAAVLLAALAVCVGLESAGLQLGGVAVLFLLPLASGSLAVAALARFARRPPPLAAGLLLAVMLVTGLAAALTGWTMVSLVPVVLFSLLIGVVALGGMAPLAALGALALLAAALAFLEKGAGTGMLLFLAAAIIGLSRAAPSAAAVEQAAGVGRNNRAIGRPG
ncbi:MAG: hypothetical protein BGN85_08450 [Alphaproteobacteria bacterium 64-11]|nr:hypothetical protein [Alphaproteobacteria bacterium]OJU10642.1 MAG: hypothetical protein BGN85_08450 [Alphaproteobacteria bacterium 64-11]